MLNDCFRNLRYFLVQSEIHVKQKLIVTCSNTISRVSRQIHLFEICLGFRLVRWIAYVVCDWLEWLHWIGLSDTQLKTAFLYAYAYAYAYDYVITSILHNSNRKSCVPTHKSLENSVKILVIVKAVQPIGHGVGK